MTTNPTPKKSRRIVWIDVARGLALLAMAIYHFSWDLEFFGYLDPGTAETGPLKWFARSIATSFLILVGIGLIMGHFRRIKWRGFGRRLAMVGGAALAITVATYFATPDAYIFFGILHEIAAASVLGLLFLRVPSVGLAALAVLWLVAAHVLKGEIFNAPWLSWIGLSTNPPRSNDFVPLFPWFAAVLAGMAAGRLMLDRNWTVWLADRPPPPNPASPVLAFLGRHSLITYLLHQPILIGCVFLASLIVPAAPPDPVQGFFGACHRSCTANAEDGECTTFCNCAISTLNERGLFDDVASGKITQTSDDRVAEVSNMCAVKAGIHGN